MRRFALVSLLLMCSCMVFAQVLGTPFSGDMTMTPKDDKPATGKIYFSGEKLRYDMAMNGRGAVIIHDIPGKVTYMLMPEAMMYMELHGDKMGPKNSRLPDLKSYDPANPCAQTPEVTCKKVGSENVNGRDAEKWTFTNAKDGKVTTVWIDKKIHFPVRTVTEGIQMDLTNIKEGQPERAMFVIPPAYRKFSAGGGMPQ